MMKIFDLGGVIHWPVFRGERKKGPRTLLNGPNQIKFEYQENTGIWGNSLKVASYDLRNNNTRLFSKTST